MVLSLLAARIIFNRRYGLDLSHLGAPLIVIYVFADVGSIGGGWLSSALLARGMDITKARKTGPAGVCASGGSGDGRDVHGQ